MSSSSDNKEHRHVVVLVLGDIGRSPRMQYHALSLLENDLCVSLIGYTGEELIPQLQNWNAQPQNTASPSLNVIRFHPLSPSRKIFPKPLYLSLRLLSLFFGLTYALWFQVKGHVDCILVQNPPAIPTLLLSFLYSRTKMQYPPPGFVIDWHNLGFTMFDDSFFNRIIRTIAKCYERFISPLADGHLCVTRAMEQWLEVNFDIRWNVAVLYDRPPDFFKKVEKEEIHDLMMRLKSEMRGCFPDLWKEDGDNSTLFTVKGANGTIEMRDDRPALLVSSTSWTPDEDFSILLDALIELDQMAIRHNKKQGTTTTEPSYFPKVLVMVTGKGPQKQMYQTKIASLRLTQISILTLWLDASDYPLLIGCADLGVSLHSSTSGIDLPMKVLDMFGCQVPVCALHFDCLDELVKDDVNGKVFKSKEELTEQLFDLLLGFPKEMRKLQVLREGIKGMTRWKENWESGAKGVILEAFLKRKEAAHVGSWMFVLWIVILAVGLGLWLQFNRIILPG